MKNNIEFWKRDYIKRFQLDREGKEILNFLTSASPHLAEQFIRDKYDREVYRCDIIDTYCDKYNAEKINKLLLELDQEPLSAEEIENYEITIKEEKTKPKCALIGQDGNIFNLMGIASKTLRNNNMKEEAKEMVIRIEESKSYDEALCIISEYVDITDDAGLEEDSEEYE